MSTFLIKLLLAEYIIIAGVCSWEKNWNWMLYFIGASVLSVAVLRMR